MKTLSHMAAVGLAALTVSFAWSGAALPVRAGDRDKARAQADRALREGEFESAERQYRELIAKDAKDEAARLGLSYALLKQRHLRDGCHLCRQQQTTITSSEKERLPGCVAPTICARSCCSA